MKLASIGPFEGTALLLRRKIERCLADFDGPVRIGLLALPYAARHEELLAAVADASGGIPVVGLTTGGAAFTERGFSRTGAVCAFLGGADLEVSCAAARDLHLDPAKSVRAALSEMDESSAAAGPRSGTPSSMLVLADGFACEGEELVSCLRQNVPPHTRVFGGHAGDDWTFEGGRVFLGRRTLSDAAVLVRMNHRQRIQVDVLHGFHVAEGGQDFTVTDIEKNVLKTLDGRPAAKVYEEELVRLGFRTSSEGVLGTMARHPLGAKTPFGEELKTRAPVAIRADGSIVLTSGFAKGQVVRLAAATTESLLHAAKTLSTRVLGQLPEVSGALVFDCATRLRLLGERYREQVRSFQQQTPGASASPLFGVSTYGEIAKFGGNVEGFHNTSSVMVGW
jgi:hypothetical protein